MDLDLVIARETVHEGQGLVIGEIIDNLVNKGRWKVVFGTGVIEVVKIHTDTNNALFFVNRDGVGEP